MKVKRMKIGLIGSPRYENKRKIRETIFRLLQRFKDDLVIVSCGEKIGAEKYIKRYALEMGCNYKEFNPSHTVKNLYSAMNGGFYGKEYKPANFFHRNKLLTSHINVIIAFMEDTRNCDGILDIIKNAKKLNKKVVIIN
tara:strand:+ start:95 stop:511 length:417 start_codon:yes stop_codon:yes gene_type:complete